MPITAIVEFTPVEGEDPREGYDLVNRALNDGQPHEEALRFRRGIARTRPQRHGGWGRCRRRRVARPSPNGCLHPAAPADPRTRRIRRPHERPRKTRKRTTSSPTPSRDEAAWQVVGCPSARAAPTSGTESGRQHESACESIWCRRRTSSPRRTRSSRTSQRYASHPGLRMVARRAVPLKDVRRLIVGAARRSAWLPKVDSGSRAGASPMSRRTRRIAPSRLFAEGMAAGPTPARRRSTWTRHR